MHRSPKESKWKSRRAKFQLRVNTEINDLNALLHAMHGRHSSIPLDKVYSIIFLFSKHECNERDMTLPVYETSTPVSVAWKQLISNIASTRIDYINVPVDNCDLWLVHQSPTIQLLCLFPHPSRHHWFPSWTQIQQYPDITVQDNDPDPVANGTDYSLRITFGRIYRGCSLQLTQPSTPETKAIYCATMDGNKAQLVATVPGVEVHIDSRSKYVLVDISPDVGLWPSRTQNCQERSIGHEHPPIWRTSVIVICEEVDTLAQPGSSAVIKYPVDPYRGPVRDYLLRRVTTLEWDCRPAGEPIDSMSRSPGRWLPFKPSLVHKKNLTCGANTRRSGRLSIGPSRPSSTEFCDPAAAADLVSKRGPDVLVLNQYTHNGEKWPEYEVYLV